MKLLPITYKHTLVLFVLFTSLVSCAKDDDNGQALPDNKIFYGDTYIETQEELERFGKNAFTIIDGNIHIASNTIDDLSPLATINEISGTLSIFPAKDSLTSNVTLKNLQGLENLKLIGNELDLYFLGGLENLLGLNNLMKVGERLTIYGCNGLTSLDGLENLDIIGRDSLHDPYEMALNITMNHSLTDFCALNDALYSGRHGVDYNAYNPTREQMKSNACKQ